MPTPRPGVVAPDCCQLVLHVLDERAMAADEHHEHSVRTGHVAARHRLRRSRRPATAKSGAWVPSSFMDEGVRAMGYSFFHYEQPNQTRRMFDCGRGDRCAFRPAAAGVGYRHEPAREQSDGGNRRTANFRRNVPDVPRRRRRRRCRPRRPGAEHDGLEARRRRRRPLPHHTPGCVGHADAAVQGPARRAGLAARQLHPQSSESRRGRLRQRAAPWCPKAMSRRAKRSSTERRDARAVTRSTHAAASPVLICRTPAGSHRPRFARRSCRRTIRCLPCPVRAAVAAVAGARHLR